MKTFVTWISCAILLFVGGEAFAKKARTKAVHHRPHKSTQVRGRAPKPLRSAPATLAEREDEVVLSPGLMRQLQRNLADGGYLPGTVDGRLTRRTRRALAEFQRDYHRPGTGTLDRATAEALLGHDRVSAYLVAKQ